MKNDLIKALVIFEKYNPDFQTFCGHDVFCICGIEPEIVSKEDIKILDDYGFFFDEETEEGFQSFRWGSC